MKALVTGATGFVGAAVARALLRQDWQVRALVRDGSDRRGNTCRAGGRDPPPVILPDRASLDRALQGCQALFHVAADYRLGARDPAQLYRTNVDGTVRIIDAARAAGVARIVYTSSVATIGIPKDATPGNEDTPVGLADMIGHYKRSKFLAEQRVLEAAVAGAPVIIVNPSTPIGPGDIKPTPTGQMVLDAANGRMPAFVDTGLNVVHVDDVAAGHVLAHAQGRIGERYILGGQDMTLREILVQIARLTGRVCAAAHPIAARAADTGSATAGGARRAAHRRQYAPDGGGLAHGRQAHVLLEPESAARTRRYAWRAPIPRAFQDALTPGPMRRVCCARDRSGISGIPA